MYKHVLLAICFLGIPFVFAQENSEILCDIPDPTGLCYKPVQGGNTTTLTGFSTEATVTGIGISGIVVLVIVGVVSAVAVAITLKKRKQTK